MFDLGNFIVGIFPAIVPLKAPPVSSPTKTALLELFKLEDIMLEAEKLPPLINIYIFPLKASWLTLCGFVFID